MGREARSCFGGAVWNRFVIHYTNSLHLSSLPTPFFCFYPAAKSFLKRAASSIVTRSEFTKQSAQLISQHDCCVVPLAGFPVRLVQPRSSCPSFPFSSWPPTVVKRRSPVKTASDCSTFLQPSTLTTYPDRGSQYQRFAYYLQTWVMLILSKICQSFDCLIEASRLFTSSIVSKFLICTYSSVSHYILPLSTVSVTASPLFKSFALWLVTFVWYEFEWENSILFVLLIYI